MSNNGIFSPKDINDLSAYGQWSGMGGQLELIQTQNVSGVVNVDFLDIKESKYNVHFLTIICESTGSNESIGVRFYESGTLNTGSSSYVLAYQNFYAAVSFDETASSGGRLFATRFNDSGEQKCSYNYFSNLGDVTRYSHQTMHSVAYHSNLEGRYGNGALPNATLVDGIRLFGTTGGHLTGVFSLYGVEFS